MMFDKWEEGVNGYLIWKQRVFKIDTSFQGVKIAITVPIVTSRAVYYDQNDNLKELVVNAIRKQAMKSMTNIEARFFAIVTEYEVNDSWTYINTNFDEKISAKISVTFEAAL
jgi:hypothetical protein